jgi:hypothetical protein
VRVTLAPRHHTKDDTSPISWDGEKGIVLGTIRY